MGDEVKEKKDLVKAAAKEAFKEFLQEKWVEFSGNFTKWALSIFAAAVLAALVWLIMTANGWKAPS